jgi:hypothetical protein
MPIAHQNAPWKAAVGSLTRSDWRATATIAATVNSPGQARSVS